MSFELELDDCLAPLGASLCGESVLITGVSIDSRTLKQGELYVAIVGERFNGHEFAAAAKAAGAAAIMVHEELNSELPQLKVGDTQVALGLLAKFWAARFSIPTIAITGSNGKTTVKEIITSILQQQGAVLATKGNLNNEIGVPLTLLNMRSEHKYAVIEMGANHAGEIARLVAMVEPDVALVTNIGTAHLEGFGSVQGIASAKSEIYAGLRHSGYGVINADDAFADCLRAACSHCRTREFGFSEGAAVCGLPDKELVVNCMGETISVRFRLAGVHNAMNALAAIAATQCLDIQFDSIVKGLEAVSAVPGRLEKKSGINGAVVIDDSYNANPDSVRAAIKVLAAYPGLRFLVLGDMGELGPDAKTMHSLVGVFAKEQGIDALWTVGDLSVEAHDAFYDSSDDRLVVRGAHFSRQALLIDHLMSHLTSEATVLVKGSRSAGMEQVVNALVHSGSDEPNPVLTGTAS